LTPKEAFECSKTVNPDAKGISKTTHGYTVQLGNGEPIINWGDTTEYPPKQKWRVPTDADKGKRCRVTNLDDVMLDLPKAIFCGLHPNGTFIVDTCLYGLLPYANCEVLDE